MEGPPSPGPDEEEWAKTKAESDIERMKAVVEDATVEEVETPTGRKDVEVAFENEDGEFVVEEGQAIGVYRERKTVLHIDWAEGGRTSIEQDDIIDMVEGDYYEE